VSRRPFLRRERCRPGRIAHFEKSARKRAGRPLPSSTPSRNKKTRKHEESKLNRKLIRQAKYRSVLCEDLYKEQKEDVPLPPLSQTNSFFLPYSASVASTSLAGSWES
jgi:hypothetical protein